MGTETTPPAQPEAPAETRRIVRSVSFVQKAAYDRAVARAEAAEAKLAAITDLCRGHLERAGAERGSVCCPHLAEDILAIADDEEK